MKFTFIIFLSLCISSLFTTQDKWDEPMDKEECEVAKSINLLLFTKTNGYIHQSIPQGINAIRNMAYNDGWKVFQTEDSLIFNDKNLKGIDVVIFLNTTLDVLGSKGEAALEKFIKNGGGFVGVHAACDTEYEWPWYYNLVGAQFRAHPTIQEAKIKVNKTNNHPSISHLGQEWIVTEEWYYFKEDMKDHIIPIMWLDETSIQGIESSGSDHPIAWYHEKEGGRMFYTGLGHTTEIYGNENYLLHLKNGIAWAGGAID